MTLQLTEEKIVGGLLGVVIGDALGLPVQFLTRTEVRENPVTGMRGGGFFDTPAGAWSDDSSLTLCLTISLTQVGYNLRDMADRFVRWFRDGYCTPFSQSFDIGHATEDAMVRLINGTSPLEAGPSDEHSNGNGSLMRILPAVLYFSHQSDEEMIEKVCRISKITHGHPRSQLGCSLYALFVKDLLLGNSLHEAYKNLQIKGKEILRGTELERELVSYKRLINGTLHQCQEEEIESSGYVVHTLEAAVWCCLTTQSYREALFKAVNLGLDTDTVGAVTGGIAGVYYGLAEIPQEWRAQLIKGAEIMDLCREFAKVVVQRG
jgi:ADP-ribosyl-[dinitrogen reductase] hydrolase